jgi:sterol desaturase/sphingolipid hydroxylase (fatty acid hydroxylase superfamily)
VFLPLEHRFPARPQQQRRVWAADLAFATVGAWLARAGTIVVVGAALAALDRVAPDQPLFAGVHDGRMRTGLDVACGLALFELGGYGYHRLAHKVPLLWRLHQIHHASESLDWLASFRQHPLEILLMTLAQNALLVLAGIPLGAHTIVVVMLKLATVFVHANLRVPDGPWDWFVATPRFHHRHHQLGGVTRNYASLLPAIDRMFGTYSAETATLFGLKPATSARASTMLSSIEQ